MGDSSLESRVELTDILILLTWDEVGLEALQRPGTRDPEVQLETIHGTETVQEGTGPTSSTLSESVMICLMTSLWKKSEKFSKNSAKSVTFFYQKIETP